jgi:hypothetical protein
VLPPKTHVRCSSKLTGHLLAAKHYTCLLSHNHLDIDQTLHTDKKRGGSWKRLVIWFGSWVEPLSLYKSNAAVRHSFSIMLSPAFIPIKIFSEHLWTVSLMLKVTKNLTRGELSEINPPKDDKQTFKCIRSC